MASRVRSDYRTINGTEKAAIIMLSVGEEGAQELFALMDEDEIREISQTMAKLGTIDSQVIENLFVEFAEQLSSTGSLTGTMDSTERLLNRALPDERVKTIMEEIRGPAGRTMWDKLANVNETVLANYLKNEYPQTVAVIVSKIRPDHAARVLSTLPEAFAMEVVMRMLHMESVQKDILDDVEQTLRTEFMSNLARAQRRDAHEMMAEIFNNLDRQAEGRFISSLEDRNRESAEKIKALMFTFEDLEKLDGTAVQTLLRVANKDKLGVALKGASEVLRDLFFSNMSERAGKILKEDMEAMGPVRLSDVDEAQTEIVLAAKDLADKGEILIADGGGDDELVY
ncbi:MAG: flagellar motor switch protein FliG [Alphaproteobacteria bacterium]|nr:flagellar motor switch protein FliG [Alphaproteobacteria bacterium]